MAFNWVVAIIGFTKWAKLKPLDELFNHLPLLKLSIYLLHISSIV